MALLCWSQQNDIIFSCLLRAVKLLLSQIKKQASKEEKKWIFRQRIHSMGYFVSKNRIYRELKQRVDMLTWR